MSARSFLPHAIWTLAAGATFAVGYLVGRPATTPGNTPDSGARADAASRETKETPWHKDTKAAVPRADGTATPAGQAVAETKDVLSADSMRATLAAILKETDPIKRNRLLAELMEKLTPENIQAAVETMQAGGMDPMNFRDIALLGFAWGKMDPAKAMAYADGLDRRGKSFITASILSGWTSTDPDAAMAWFKEQKFSGFEKNIAARGMIEGLVQNNLQTATRMAMSETDTEVQGQFFDAIARQQVKTGGVAATKDWIDSLVSAGSVNADQLSGAAREVADQWSKTDPKAATTWAMGLPDSEAQRDALRPAIREWGSKDPTATSEYLTSLASSPAKDRAVQQFSETIAKEDPKAALTWASSIEDSGRRERATVRAAQEWYQTDAAAATEWAATSTLSEESKKKVSETPDRGGWQGFGGRFRGR